VSHFEKIIARRAWLAKYVITLTEGEAPKRSSRKRLDLFGAKGPVYFPALASQSRCGSSGDVVRRRIGDIVGFDLGRTLDDFAKFLQYFSVASGVVSIGLFPQIP